MKITVTISEKDISYLLISALEGACRYWGSTRSVTKYTGATPPKRDEAWYADEKVLDGGFTCKVEYDDPKLEEGNGKGRKTVTLADIQNGLTLMVKNSPKIFAEIISGNGDADTADVFWQYVVLGEVIYG